METKALGDPSVFPSEGVIASRLGRANAAFTALLEANRAAHPDFEERWKYYNDGKSWLFNVSRRKKTLFWLSVDSGSFRTTFYLSPRAEEAVLGAAMPDGLKEQYRAAEGKKMRNVTLVVKAKKDLAAYEALLAIKLASM